MLHGFATEEGTRLFTERFSALASNGFYRIANDLRISSLGMGTYLGADDARTDQSYEQAAIAALRSGINFFDTAINYRNLRSERALGSALRAMLNANEVQRDQVVVATKAAFLTPGAIPDWLREEHVVGGMHSMTPDFLEDQIDRSRANLDLDTIDIFFVHNPETQLNFVRADEVERRLQAAFERLERLVRERKIRWYGVATWDGFREAGRLDLSRVVGLARYVGGEEHHMRWVQLPFNFGMIEAYVNRDGQGVSPLKMAERAGVTVVASATLQQGRFAKGLPELIRAKIPELNGDAAKAVQFTRSTPGIAVALVGMSSPEHVTENLEVSRVPEMGAPDYEKLYRSAE